MVQVQLSGGLGNQLFQYAAALAFAKKNNCDLYLDTSFYDNSKNRKFELSSFNISSKYSKNNIWTKFYNAFHNHIFNKKNVPFKNLPIYKEFGFSYDKNLLNQKIPLILEGYWQSEKYFASVAAIIRKEFQWKNADKFYNLPLLNEINSCNSVSIHLRKGDYLSNSLVNAIHGIVPNEYYMLAIDLIKSKTKIDKIYIFSDDLKAADEFIREYGIGINASALNDNTMLDFYLLQKCKHNIIANSSFSWWSAWLNSNPNKIVVAPKRWFVDQSINTSDIIPENWITL